MGKCWPGPEFKFSKTVEVRWLHKDLQLCQREITTESVTEWSPLSGTDEIQGKKIIESTAI